MHDDAIFIAIARSDYTAVSSSFPPFPVPGAMECVNISIIDDVEQEITEVFNISVLIVTGDTKLQSVPIRITDNDG
jgi:hypothetical protein